MPFPQSGKIQEPEVDRFFNFIGMAFGEKNIGYMSLDTFYLAGCIRINFGIKQSYN